MNFEEKIIERLKRLEREVKRLRAKERPAGGSGVSDHGALTGLSDNDHPQYLLTTGKAADSDKLDGIDSTGFATAGHDHDSDYLGISAKAADSDKLDGLDSTDFATAGHDHDSDYLGISAKAADSDKLDGKDSSAFVLASAVGTWQDWTPSEVTGWSKSVLVTRYMLIRKTCFFYIQVTSGTSNSTSTVIALPFTPAYATNGTNGFAVNNGTQLTVASRWRAKTDGNIYFYTNMYEGAWTASGDKRVYAIGFYEVDD